MNRLMRAELYRLTHSNHFVWWIGFMCIAASAISVVGIIDYDFNCTLDVAMQGDLEMFTFFVPLISVFVSIIVISGYSNKTSYYEVMAGNRISKIIGSKVLVDAVLIAALTFLFLSIVPVIMCIKNGRGAMTDIPARFGLFFVIVFHCAVSGLFFSTAIRHIVAPVAAYVRIPVEMCSALILDMVFNGDNPFWYQKDWFLFMQLTNVFTGELSFKVVIGVFGSLFLEAALLYLITYYGMKKKKYN